MIWHPILNKAGCIVVLSGQKPSGLPNILRAVLTTPHPQPSRSLDERTLPEHRMQDRWKNKAGTRVPALYFFF